MKKFSIFISGRGSNMEALLRAHAERILGAQPVLVISNKQDAGGLEIARRFGIKTEIVQWRDAAEAERRCIELLKESGTDFVVLAGFMRILSEQIISAFPRKIINIHPSLLPSFPGAHAQKQALDHGVRVTGCTTHFVNAGVDTGEIILQSAVPVMDGDDEDTLSRRILEKEHTIIVETVNLMAGDCLEFNGDKSVHIRYDRYHQSRRNHHE